MGGLSRRGFLFVCGAAATGLWLAKTGLVALPGRMVAYLSGSCSFCGWRSPDVQRLAGVVGRSARICNNCIGLCLDIITEEGRRPIAPAPPPPPVPADLDEDELSALLAAVAAGEPPEERVEQIRRLLDGQAPRPDFQCSFCDARRREVAKLIAGPRVFVCDRCVADAASLCPEVLRLRQA